MNNGKLLFRNFVPYITSNFGNRIHPITKEYTTHLGVDYGTNDQKLPTYAIENGQVLKTGYSNISGNFVYVNYKRLGKIALYQHLDRINVTNGQNVDRNTIIGYVGETGQVTGIHLHFGWFSESEFNKGWYERNWEDFEKYEYIKELEIIGTTTEPNQNLDQIEVLVDDLRARKEPNGEIFGYIKKGLYNILDTYQDENYTWYKVETDTWIAYSNSWAKIYDAIKPEISEDNDKLNNPNDVLDNEVNEEEIEKQNIFQIIYLALVNFFKKIINFFK